MAHYNKFVMMGRVTKEPEIKMSAKGNRVATFTLANDIGYKDNEKTNFAYCVAGNTKFNLIADQIEAMKITPQAVIVVEGTIELRPTRKFENVPQQDGSVKTEYLGAAPLFIVTDVSYVSVGGGKKKQDGTQMPAQNGYAPQNAPATGMPAPQMVPQMAPQMAATPMPASLQPSPVSVPGVGTVAPASMPGINGVAAPAAPTETGYTVIDDEDLPF